MRNNSNELAETGVITTTSEPKGYPHPSNPNIKLWDLPGLGTAAYPDTKTYYEKLELASQYNAFLLFIRTRLTVDSKRLAIRLESTRKPFLFIRTFIDVDIDNEKKNKPNTFNEAKIVDEIRQNTLRGLNDLDSVSGEEIFLISNVKLEKWDFDRLNNQILYELPSRNAAASCLTTKLSTRFKVAKLTYAERLKNLNIDKETVLKYVEKSQAKAKRNIQDNGIKAAQKLMEEELDKWKEVKISLAIIGFTGVGKSSFINAIRRINDDQPNAAPTGTTETTMDLEVYHSDEYPNITLFDCPGIGTETFSNLKTYCKKVDIAKYDAFILMSATRFDADSGNLAKKLKSINKPFFFVRTKIDQDYVNERKKKRSEFNEVAMLEFIKADCSKNLKLKCATLDDKDIFLISNSYPSKWDFARLTEAIRKRLPRRKRECFLFSMTILSEDILEKKVEKLKGRVKYVAFFFSMIVKAFTKTPYSRKHDFNLIVEKVEFYRSQLGFPNEDSEEFRMMNEVLQNEVRRFFLTSQIDVETWLEMFDTKNCDKDTECGDEDTESDDDVTESDDENTESDEEKEVSPPLLDMKIAKNARYEFVYRSLRNILDEMKKIALEILNEAVARSEPEIDID